MRNRDEIKSGKKNIHKLNKNAVDFWSGFCAIFEQICAFENALTSENIMAASVNNIWGHCILKWQKFGPKGRETVIKND